MQSQHCSLDGSAGRNLARKHGLSEADLSYFVTEAGLQEYEDMGTYKITCTDLFNSETHEYRYKNTYIKQMIIYDIVIQTHSTYLCVLGSGIMVSLTT